MYHKTAYPDLVVDVSIKNSNDDKIRVSGIAINPNDELPYQNIPAYTTKPVSFKRRNAAAAEVVTKLERLYFEIHGAGVADDKSMIAAFNSVKIDVNEGSRLRPEWKAPSTNANAIKFFERNVLPLVLPFADSSNTLYSTDRTAIQNALIAICTRHMGGNDSGDPDITAKAVEAAMRHLQEADVILAKMREKDDRIPEIILSSAECSTVAWRQEQIKMLEQDVLYRFYTILYALIESEPANVFFAVFAVYGLRPAEAAARKPNEIIYHKDYCVVHVTTQEDHGKIVSRLKNKYSRRTVVISSWGLELLKKCSDKMADMVCAEGDAMHRATDCAEWVKQRLLESGASESVIKKIGETIDEDDLDDDCIGDDKDYLVAQQNRAQKIACYVLRRCFATIMRTVMGFSLIETDRMLGHVPVKAKSNYEIIDMNSEEAQASIAKKMERYIFDERFTRNPLITPISLEQGRVSLIEYTEYHLQNTTNQALEVNVNFEASEPGETIEVDLTESANQQLATISTPKSWENTARTVIGDCTSKAKGRK